MSDLSRDDVERAVREQLQNELRDVKNEVNRIKDSVERMAHQLQDFDDTKRRIQDMSDSFRNLSPHLEEMTRNMQGDDIEQIERLSADTQQRVQNMERGMAQLIGALQAEEKLRQEDAGYRSL